MIDPINAASSAAGARLSQTTTAVARSSTRGGASFAGELARYVSTTSPAVKAKVEAEPRPDNEQTTKVSGHPYSRIENGADKGLYLNQLENSPRVGAVFKLVERDNRVFHVYGEGKDKLVVEVKKKAAATSTAPTGGTTPAAT